MDEKIEAGHSVSSNGPGQLSFSVSRSQNEVMDLFLHELMFNHGVYYYLCSPQIERK